MVKNLKIITAAVVLITWPFPFFIPTLAQADTVTKTLCETDPAHYAHSLDSGGNPLNGCSKIITPKEAETVCPSGHVDAKDTTKCEPLGNGCPQKAHTTGICQDNPIVKDLNNIVNVLSGLVGVVVVGVIILGGIQYAMAGDKAEAVSAAKQRITNGIIALVAFLFIFAFLQWLIPGGIFG